MKKKITLRKVILFAAFLMPLLALRAQINYSDTIDDGYYSYPSTMSALPGFYGYHLSAALYDASEINHAAGVVQSLSYHITYGNTFYWMDQRVKIYLMETTDSILDLSMTWNQLTANAMLVYDSTDYDLQYDDYWKEFLFTQPFPYHGGNLVVLVEGYGCSATGSVDCETSIMCNEGSACNCWNRMQDNTSLSFTTVMASMPAGVHGNNSDRADVFFTFNSNADTCTLSLPYAENFENYPGFYTDIPNCWNTISSYPTAYNTYYPIINPGSSSDSQSMMFMIEGNASEFAILPSIPAQTAMQDVMMTFRYKSTVAQSNVTYLVVGVMSDPADTSTFVPVASVTKVNSTAGWEDKEINFATYTGTGKHIAFCLSGRNTTAMFPSCFVDDVAVFEAPDCVAPVNIASTVGQNGVTVTWQANNNANGVRLYYKSFADTSYVSVDVLQDTFYSFQSLSDGMIYQYYLTTLCDSSNESAASQIYSFTTPCNVVSVYPWSDGFENGAACWSFESSVSGQNWTLVTQGDNPACLPHSGSYMMKMNNYTLSAGNWCALISPAFDMTQDMMLSYFYHSYSFQMYDDSVEVYYNDQPNLANATLLKTFHGNQYQEVWNKDTVMVPAPANGGVRYVIFKAISDYGFNIFLDDISMSPLTPDTGMVYVTIDTAICDGESVDFYGGSYGTAGVYEIESADSVISLNLIVNPTYTIVLHDTIQEGETYTQYGFNESSTGTYYQYLTTEAGCDSTVVLNLTVIVGIELNEPLEMSVYPNPATQYILLSVNGLEEDVQVELFDLAGQCVRRSVIRKGTTELWIERGNLSNGVYLLNLKGDGVQHTRKVIFM